MWPVGDDVGLFQESGHTPGTFLLDLLSGFILLYYFMLCSLLFYPIPLFCPILPVCVCRGQGSRLNASPYHFSTPFSESESLTEPKAHQFGYPVYQPVSGIHLPLPTSPLVLRLQVPAASQAFMWFLACKQIPVIAEHKIHLLARFQALGHRRGLDEDVGMCKLSHGDPACPL